jgi:hypothetical protein
MDGFAIPALVVAAMPNDCGRIGAPREVPAARPTIAVHAEPMTRRGRYVH